MHTVQYSTAEQHAHALMDANMIAIQRKRLCTVHVNGNIFNRIVTQYMCMQQSFSLERYFYLGSHTVMEYLSASTVL